MSWQFSHRDSERAQESDATKGNSNCEGGFQPNHICLENSRKHIWREYFMQFRRTCRKHKTWTHSWSVTGKRGEEPVNKGRLSRRGAECTANCLKDCPQHQLDTLEYTEIGIGRDVHKRFAVTAARSSGPTLAWATLKPCIMPKAIAAPTKN